MSRATGMVRFPDEEIFYFEYNGTIDYPASGLYATAEELNKNWRKSNSRQCTCGSQEDVEAHSNYGNGYYFHAQACKRCMSVTFDPDLDDIEDTAPTWAEEDR